MLWGNMLYSNNHSIHPIRKTSQVRKPRLLVSLVVTVGFFKLWNDGAYNYYPFASSPALARYTLNTKNNHNDVQVFEWKDDNFEPKHLDLIDTDLRMESRSFADLDLAHRQHLIHKGAWIAVSWRGKILVVKRGPRLITCPNSWGIVGEHTSWDETPTETVVRAIFEEIGLGKDAIRVVNFLTEHPVYYERSYPNNDNRMDKQVTYLWLVELNAVKDTSFHFDSEVSETRWVSKTELQDWVHTNPNDFCHQTIQSLLQLVLDRLDQIHPML